MKKSRNKSGKKLQHVMKTFKLIFIFYSKGSETKQKKIINQVLGGNRNEYSEIHLFCLAQHVSEDCLSNSL